MLLLEPADNPLCQLAYGTPEGSALCHQMQAKVRRTFECRCAAAPVNCLAGLTIIAVPVRMCGEYVATLHTNRLFLRKPRAGDIRQFADKLKRWGAKPDLSRLRQDFAGIPIIAREQVEAIVRLLGIYAEHLGDLASRRVLADQHGRPCAVAQALAYMREHQTEHLSLHTVAEQARLSPYYFCKLFGRTLGMTFTEYLTRLRLERAKDLLMSPTMPVSDIALAAGFGSIPHFNRAFKRYTGVTPTHYRSNHSGAVQLPAPAA
jgi:AraC-like DNA-binding protein